MTTDLNQIVELNGISLKIRELPISERPFFGYGHFPSHGIGRTILPGNWPYTFDTCLEADNPRGVWIDDEHLACTGCGLDST